MPGEEQQDDSPKRARVEKAPKSQTAEAREKVQAREEVISKSERKAKLAQILRRGFTNDRLEVKDPDPNRFYAWIRERDEDVIRFQNLGFRVETDDEVETEGPDGTADNRIRVGDLILMSTSKDNREMIREAKEELKREKLKAGKKEYARKASGRDIPIHGSSLQEVAE